MKYENTKQGIVTTFSFSDNEKDKELILSHKRVVTIEQGNNKIVLRRSEIDRLPKFADKFNVK